MYVSIMCFPKFYKKHMNLLVAFCGAAYVNFTEAPVKKIANIQCLRSLLKCLSPGILNFQSTFCSCCMNCHAISKLNKDRRLANLDLYPTTVGE